jgi:hypothetical protein
VNPEQLVRLCNPGSKTPPPAATWAVLNRRFGNTVSTLVFRFRENKDVRKRVVSSVRTTAKPGPGAQWMDLGQIATVEVTSEDPKFPIESVFNADAGPGWRASQKGEQQIRLIFDQPLAVRRIQLHFLETTCDRLQEFTLRWLAADGGNPREILRQQWNFSPAGSTSEVEDYEVNLEGVSALELAIKPDLAHNEALATLAAWRVA